MRFYRKPKSKYVARKFAFLPFTIDNETRWLEIVYYEKSLCHYGYGEPVPLRFITKEEYKKRRYL